MSRVRAVDGTGICYLDKGAKVKITFGSHSYYGLIGKVVEVGSKHVWVDIPNGDTKIRTRAAHRSVEVID